MHRSALVLLRILLLCLLDIINLPVRCISPPVLCILLLLPLIITTITPPTWSARFLPLPSISVIRTWTRIRLLLVVNRPYIGVYSHKKIILAQINKPNSGSIHHIFVDPRRAHDRLNRNTSHDGELHKKASDGT